MRHRSAIHAWRIPIVFATVGFLFAVVTILSPPSQAINQTVVMNLSYRIVGQSSQAPVLTYFFDGTQRTTILTANPTDYVADAGTPWSVPAQLRGSNATARWATQVSSGTATNITLTFAYYYQFRAYFNYSVVGGGSGPISVDGVTQWGSTTSLNAGTLAWVDSGSGFSYPSLIQPAPGQRWVSNGQSGFVSKPSNYTEEYYHQYLFISRYSAEGVPPAPPSLQGVSFAVPVQQELSSTNSSIWLDSGTRYTVTDPLQGSNLMSRWYATGGRGIVASPTYLSLTYYHQFSITGSYSVVGGNSPAAPQLLSTFSGTQGGLFLTDSPTVYWVDAGSSYTVPILLAGSSSQERWAMDGTLAGVATSAASFHATYYHQDLIRLTSSGSERPVHYLNFTSFGTPVTVQIVSGTTSQWGDNGTSIAIGSGTPNTQGGRWALGTALPKALTTPLDLTLQYFQQFEINLSYSVSGGGNPTPPTLSGTSLGLPLRANLSSKQITFWLDANSPWSIPSAIPGAQGQERWITNNSSGGNVTEPISEQAIYVHQYYVTIQIKQGSGSTSPPSGWYGANSTLRLSATPAQGLSFDGWQGTGSGSYSGSNSTASLPLSGPITELSDFGLRSVLLQVAASPGGSVTYSLGFSQGSIGAGVTSSVTGAPGTNVTLTANPSSFLYVFSGWSGSATSTDERLVFRLDSSGMIIATFGVNYAALAGLIALWGTIVIGVALFWKYWKRLVLAKRVKLVEERKWE